MSFSFVMIVIMKIRAAKFFLNYFFQDECYEH